MTWLNVVLTPQQQYATGEPDNVQGRDRVGIVEGPCGYRARGVGILEKFVLSKNLGYKTNGVATWLNLVLNPKQRYATGVPGKVQGRDRVGFAEGSSGYRTRGVSIRRKFVLSRNMGYTTRRVATCLNIVLTHPQQRYAMVEPCKAQGRDRVGIVVGSCEKRACWVSIRRKFVLSRNLRIATWLNIVLTAPTNGTPLESQAKFMDGTVWGS